MAKAKLCREPDALRANPPSTSLCYPREELPKVRVQYELLQAPVSTHTPALPGPLQLWVSVQ